MMMIGIATVTGPAARRGAQADNLIVAHSVCTVAGNEHGSKQEQRK